MIGAAVTEEAIEPRHPDRLLKEKDIRDVAALCEKLGIDNPLAK